MKWHMFSSRASADGATRCVFTSHEASPYSFLIVACFAALHLQLGPAASPIPASMTWTPSFRPLTPHPAFLAAGQRQGAPPALPPEFLEVDENTKIFLRERERLAALRNQKQPPARGPAAPQLENRAPPALSHPPRAPAIGAKAQADRRRAPAPPPDQGHENRLRPRHAPSSAPSEHRDGRDTPLEHFLTAELAPEPPQRRGLSVATPNNGLPSRDASHFENYRETPPDGARRGRGGVGLDAWLGDSPTPEGTGPSSPSDAAAQSFLAGTMTPLAQPPIKGRDVPADHR